MSIEIRALGATEFRAASNVLSTAMLHGPPNDEDWTKREPTWHEADSIAAYDGDRLVATMGGFRFETLVPGGAWLATSGVTRVGVATTHRRQGLASKLMGRLLNDARDRGQVLASLRASEAIIYPRFGFGLAGRCAEVLVSPRDTRGFTGSTAGSFRILGHDEILDTLPAIYQRCTNRPGVIRRPTWIWKRYFEKATELGNAEFVAVHTSADGVDDGYAHYSLKWNEARFSPPTGAGEVYDLWGATPGVEIALWEYLCGIDLVCEWHAEERPIDEATQLAVADARSFQVKFIWDEQWFRLLDVDAALTARVFNDVADAFTIAVTDPMLPANDGVWEISAAGARRSETEAAAADIAADQRELAATYLGDVRWSALAAAGRVDVRSHAALATADALFLAPVAPFCCTGF